LRQKKQKIISKYLQNFSQILVFPLAPCGRGVGACRAVAQQRRVRGKHKNQMVFITPTRSNKN